MRLLTRLADSGRTTPAAFDLIVELAAALWAPARFQLQGEFGPGAGLHGGKLKMSEAGCWMALM
jgi:hypothetical protein